MNEPNYSSFGARGAEFHQFLEDCWGIIERRWNDRLLMDESLSPFGNALNEVANRSGYLFSQFCRLEGSLAEQSAMALWESVRQIFVPALAAADIVGQHRYLTHWQAYLELFAELYENMPIRQKRFELNRICYAPFRGDELDWILRKYPRIVELGGGGLYFADCFLRRGGDILSIDNDQYGTITWGPLHPWTTRFLSSGRFAVGSVEQLAQYAEDRTLLIAAPEPGSAFPAEALETYAAAGGRTFLFKVTGFFGGPPATFNPIYTPPDNPDENVIRFFHILASHWREVDDPSRPPFIPQYMGNNLLVFEYCGP